MENQMKKWILDGYVRTNHPISIPMKSRVAYITNDDKIRKGGVLIFKTKEYLQLKNYAADVKWSVQYSNVKYFFYTNIKDA